MGRVEKTQFHWLKAIKNSHDRILRKQLEVNFESKADLLAAADLY